MTETYQQQHQQHVSLNTPIKKIRNLNLNSSPIAYDGHQQQEQDHGFYNEYQYPDYNLPQQPQPPTKLYPSIDLQKSPTESCMLDKGYSHKLTNNVLSELHKRAQQITTGQYIDENGLTQYSSNVSPSYGIDDQVSQRRNKRYSGVHMSKFKQMESISHHYSVHNRNKTPSPQKLQSESEHGVVAAATPAESASKRRQTLNENNEITAIPILHQQQDQQSSNSPENRKISPNKISPSKASYNLNSILRQTTDTGSPNKEVWDQLQPPPKIVPQLKKRPSSLEMAGVINSSPTRYNETGSGSGALKPSMLDKPMGSNSHGLMKEPSKLSAANSTHHSLGPRSFVKTSHPASYQSTLNKKPSIPQLQRKSSIPLLQKKPSIPQMQRKSSIPQLQRKPSIPQFNNHQSNTGMMRSTTSSSTSGAPAEKTSMKPPSSTTLHHQNKVSQQLSNKYSNEEASNQPSISRMSPSKSFSSFTQRRGNMSNKGLSHSQSQSQSLNGGKDTSKPSLHKSKSVTIPQPFSLYDKPTISSSQKSLNKYQRFKEKFQ